MEFDYAMSSDNQNANYGLHKPLPRRCFLQKSVAIAAGAVTLSGFEEKALLAQQQSPAAASSDSSTTPQVAQGNIGPVKISRLICGGNLISGYGHSRDLIYISHWLRNYFTDEKIMETWALCEQHGINTMITYAADPRAVAIYQKYRAQGGRIQYLSQLNPDEKDLKTSVKQAQDSGACGAFLLGNLGDEWVRSGAVGRIGELVALIKEHKMIAGVAGHEIRVPQKVEEAKINPDFYMKTIHSTKYWSTRRPEQTKEVIDNYDVDNYWCLDANATISYMRAIQRPWIAYKVLAAGAIHPRAGFRFAFENGADFAAVGLFDFQVKEDTKIMAEIMVQTQKRDRPWMA